ncbi:MAG TPA: FHA domain-containing protein [Planctomycetaceae bacterium]|nr:FHA domain-containing protein [Planctomycetaceae bacterium]
MIPQLTPAAVPDTGSIRLQQFPTVVGRDGGADVQLTNPEVSHFHCVLDWIDGVMVVRDLGSRTGTHINGMRISEAQLLPGDRLSLGPTTFEVEYDAPEVRQREETVAPICSPAMSPRPEVSRFLRLAAMAGMRMKAMLFA